MTALATEPERTPVSDEAKPHSAPLDVSLLLELWHGGPACRDVALEMADASYQQFKERK